MTNLQINVGVLGSVSKGLKEKVEIMENRGRIEIVQTTAMLRSSRIQRKVLQTCGDSLSPNPQ